jgi:hypothetical protein
VQVGISEALRALARGNAGAQLWLAQVPGAVAALVQLLGADDGDVADAAAETLAALQQDSAEVRALVAEVSRVVVLGLGQG